VKWNTGSAIEDPEREQKILQDVGAKAKQAQSPIASAEIAESQVLQSYIRRRLKSVTIARKLPDEFFYLMTGVGSSPLSFS